MPYRLTVPAHGSFHLDAGSAEEVGVLFEERQDIEVVLDAAGPQSEEAAKRAAVDRFERPGNGFPLYGVGHQLIVPCADGGLVARLRRRWSGDRMTITVTIPRDVRLTVTTRFPDTVKSQTLDVSLLLFLGIAEGERTPLKPETVESLIVREGRVHCLERSSLEKRGL